MARFLTTFEKILMHYRWHTEASRAEWEQHCSTIDVEIGKIVFLRTYIPQEPHPGPIDVKLVRALKKAANGLWQEMVNVLAIALDPLRQGVFAKAMFPNTTRRVLAILVAHCDWSDEQIAEEAGVSRGHLYRLPAFTEWRAKLKEADEDDAKNEALHGDKYRDKDHNQVFEAFEEVPNLRRRKARHRPDY
jgi:hypothetical protein